MSNSTIVIIAVGLIFPVISLLSGIASLIARVRYKKHASPVFIPFIGPLMLTGLIVFDGYPLWLIPIVWIADIGTVAFLWVIPRLIAEWWAHSRFTRILVLEGTHENQSALLTLHSTGHYLLKKKWQRARGEMGIIELGEPGTFTSSKDGYRLVAHHGLRRTLRAQGGGSFVVEEEDRDDFSTRNYSLKHWHFKA